MDVLFEMPACVHTLPTSPPHWVLVQTLLLS
jgi:hypothetical protein